MLSHDIDADGTWPSNCDPSDPLNKAEIAEIEGELYKYWISYKQDSFPFWSHEWYVILHNYYCRSTHGTCAKGHSGITGQKSFFQTTLSGLHTVAMEDVFSNAGLVPSNTNTYTSNDIMNANYT